MNKLILYTTDDGKSQIQLQADLGTVWLTQLEMAELFDATKQNISLHLKNIIEDGELDAAATIKESLTVQTEGTRQVQRPVTWKGTQVRKQDTVVAKNYLTEDEVDTLNRLVVIFLETAELRAKRQTITSMGFWRENVGQIIVSNGFPLLSGAGIVSHARMEQKLEPLYLDFDQRRKAGEARAADAQDEADLKALENTIKRRPKP